MALILPRTSSRDQEDSGEACDSETDYGRSAPGEGRGRGAGCAGQRDTRQGRGRVPLPLRSLREQAVLRRRPQASRLQVLESDDTAPPSPWPSPSERERELLIPRPGGEEGSGEGDVSSPRNTR